MNYLSYSNLPSCYLLPTFFLPSCYPLATFFLPSSYLLSTFLLHSCYLLAIPLLPPYYPLTCLYLESEFFNFQFSTFNCPLSIQNDTYKKRSDSSRIRPHFSYQSEYYLLRSIVASRSGPTEMIVIGTSSCFSR